MGMAKSSTKGLGEVMYRTTIWDANKTKKPPREMAEVVSHIEVVT